MSDSNDAQQAQAIAKLREQLARNNAMIQRMLQQLVRNTATPKGSA